MAGGRGRGWREREGGEGMEGGGGREGEGGRATSCTHTTSRA